MLISKFDNTNLDAAIRELEKMYNLVLPDEYRNFLIKYNGGRTPDTKFRINGVSSDIQGFYGLGNANEYYHFDRLKKVMDWNKWLDSNMFPVATNASGDYIMIGTGVGNEGRVYFSYHDRPPRYIELASDFTTFIRSCKSNKIGYIRSIEERTNDMIKAGKGNKITPEKIAGWQAEIDEYGSIHQEQVVID